MSSTPKRFHLSNDKIRDLAPGRGWCVATDHILVEGRQVGAMLREEPVNIADSGWRFFSGLESDEYLNDPDNLEDYIDVNSLANYDPDIIPFLDSPVGSEFERDEILGVFIPLVDPEENELFPAEAAEEGLNPRFPAVTGDQQLP